MYVYICVCIYMHINAFTYIMNVYIKNDQYWNIIIEVTAQYNTPRNTLFVWMLQAHSTHTSPKEAQVNVLQSCTMGYSGLQYAVHLWQPENILFVWMLKAHKPKHTATHCNTLQHTTTHCNMDAESP